ncbi:hypothetical protein [Flagellimonas sp.]|uniref:hypothetical protein n=1 Tax=Flagellimonas sp. TaxID=2058762 RepID=UPI003BAD8208
MDIAALIISILAVLFTGLSYAESKAANANSKNAIRTNKKMFRRQGIIDLHMAWNDVKEINPDKLVTPDIVRAVNAMSLTASLWNHDVIEKAILYQSYWNNYRKLYETLIDLDKQVPGKNETCKELVTNDIKRAYEAMKNVNLEKVITNL